MRAEKIAYSTESVRIRITRHATIHGPMETLLNDRTVPDLFLQPTMYIAGVKTQRLICAL